jgi:rare lipoprotein A
MKMFSWQKTLPCLLLTALGLAGCSTVNWDDSSSQSSSSSSKGLDEKSAAVDLPRSRSGNPPFYEVYDVRYTVMASSAGYREKGVASWYGKKFHGRSTSSGERYDMHAMTAAHKTLPLPTNVRVTNLENGKSIILRVNDRGPFVKNRLIDLSYAAATELDVVAKGTALVEVVALNSAYLNPAGQSIQASASANAGRKVAMYLQVGAFGERANADKLAQRLTASGMQNVRVHESANQSPRLYRVRIGPVHSVAAYDDLNRKIEAMQVGSGHLVVESATTTSSGAISGG